MGYLCLVSPTKYALYILYLYQNSYSFVKQKTTDKKEVLPYSYRIEGRLFCMSKGEFG